MNSERRTLRSAAGFAAEEQPGRVVNVTDDMPGRAQNNYASTIEDDPNNSSDDLARADAGLAPGARMGTDEARTSGTTLDDIDVQIAAEAQEQQRLLREQKVRRLEQMRIDTAQLRRQHAGEPHAVRAVSYGLGTGLDPTSLRRGPAHPSGILEDDTGSSSLVAGDDAISHKRHASRELATRPRKSIKIDNLPAYYGKSEREHREFIRKAKTAFRLSPDHFHSDEIKILWTMGFLKGEAHEIWSTHEESIDLGTTPFEYFSRYLLDLVSDPENRLLSHAQEYMDTRQKAGQSVQAFHAYLSTLESQLPPYSNEHQRAHFFTKLRPELRSAITNYQDIPKTLPGLIALASRLEGNIGMASSTAPSRSQDAGGSLSKQKGSDKKSSGPTKKETPASSSKEGSGRQVQCYNCDEWGHISTACPKPPRPKEDKTDAKVQETKVSSKGNKPKKAEATSQT